MLSSDLVRNTVFQNDVVAAISADLFKIPT